VISLIQNLDTNALLYIQYHLRFGFLNTFKVFNTNLGDSGLIWILLGFVLLIPQKTRRGAFDALICLSIAVLINDFVIKGLVSRPRPYLTIKSLSILVEPLSSFSFPSGHADSSFAMAFALTLAFGRRGAIAFIPAALIAFSRCYVGVHYPSDVIAGAIVGTLVSWGVYVLLKKYVKTDLIREKKAE